MKAIQIKYLLATDTKRSHWKAWTEAGSMAADYNYALGPKENALALATAYCERHGWDMPKGIGSIPNNDYVVTLEVVA
jgi:hypothetical protein